MSTRRRMIALVVTVALAAAGPVACKSSPAQPEDADPVEQPAEQAQAADDPAPEAAAPDAGASMPTYAGQIHVMGQPDRAALEAARAQGVTLVVNLRTPGEEGAMPEEAQLVEELGMRYVSIPVAKPGGTQPDGLTAEHARALGEALEQADPGAALVHCGSGNRAAALLALHDHLVRGTDPQVALERAQAAGLASAPLEALMRERMSAEEGAAAP